MRLNLYSDINDARLVEYINMFPELRGKVLTRLGHATKRRLRRKYTNETSAYAVDYRRKVYASDGTALANYSVRDLNRFKTRVRVTSFPLNLFDQGRLLRSGKREPAKDMMKKTAFDMRGSIDGIAGQVLREVLYGIEQS